MPTDQYHEPPEELSPETRTFARLCTSLTEEAEAIGWYQQRLALEADHEARAIMADAQGEEFKHFCMDLEFLLRRTPIWREIAQGILFQDGDIVEQCFQYEECGLYRPFVAAGKAVFEAEYELDPSQFCGAAAAIGFSAIRKSYDLFARPWEPCA